MAWNPANFGLIEYKVVDNDDTCPSIFLRDLLDEIQDAEPCQPPSERVSSTHGDSHPVMAPYLDRTTNAQSETSTSSGIIVATTSPRRIDAANRRTLNTARGSNSKRWNPYGHRPVTRSVTASKKLICPGSSETSTSSDRSLPGTPDVSSCTHPRSIARHDTIDSLTLHCVPNEGADARPCIKSRRALSQHMSATTTGSQKEIQSDIIARPAAHNPKTKQVRCEIIDPGTNSICGTMISCGNATEIKSHTNAHFAKAKEYWEAQHKEGSEKTPKVPSMSQTKPKTKVKAKGRTKKAKLCFKMTCTWKGCKADLANKMAEPAQWKKHMITLPTHFSLMYHCPVQGCSDVQRRDVMPRHLKKHKELCPQEGWRANLTPWAPTQISN